MSRTTHTTFVNNGRSSPLSPSWSDSSSASEHDDEPSSPKRSTSSSSHSSTSSVSRRGPGGRGGGGNNASGVKGPRWNEERKTMVLERFLQPFVTRELYRLDLQAALEAFIIEQEWDDAPMKDMVTRIKRLLTNARDINKKKAARGGASTAKSTSLSQQKKKDVAVKVEKKAKVVSASKAKKTAAPLPTPITTTTPAPVALVAATVVVKAEVPAPVVRPVVSYKPKMVVDASPLASLSNVAAAVAKRQSFGLIPPPISIPSSSMMPPWSPSQSSESSANDSISDASDVDESADGEANPLLAFLHGAPCTPMPSSIAVATPVLSLASSNTSTYSEDDVDSVDVSYDYCSLPFSFDGEAPLPMLPSLPSLMVPLTPRIQVPVLSADNSSSLVDSGVDAVDAAPIPAAVYQYVPGTGMVLSVQAPVY